MTYAPETEFGRSVRDDALKCGHTSEMAALIAHGVEHPPSPEAIDRMPARTRAFLGVRARADRPVDDIASLAAAVGADALLPALRDAALPLADVTALLRDALDWRTLTITPAGMDQVRLRLHARHYYGGQLA